MQPEQPAKKALRRTKVALKTAGYNAVVSCKRLAKKILRR
jgi:hypothetical protein